MTSSGFEHVLPGQHVYDDVLFFGYSPPDVLDGVKEFPVRNDDVFIVTYPKAGTTWMQEILWLIMNEGDFEGAHKKPVYFRSPFLEFKDDILNEVGLELAEPMPSPRVMKTHLQPSMVPRSIAQTDCKIVLVFRNPKDLCVSYYHFYKSSSSVGNFKGTWSEFLEMFKAGHVDHGSWFDFTRLWWEQRDNPNVKLVFYEDMNIYLSYKQQYNVICPYIPQNGITIGTFENSNSGTFSIFDSYIQNLPEAVKSLCEFMGRPLDGSTVERIAKHCEFKNMKENPMTNHLDVYSIDSKISPLLRKGEVGDWMNYFTVAQDKEFESFYNDRLGALEIPFTYQL